MSKDLHFIYFVGKTFLQRKLSEPVRSEFHIPVSVRGEFHLPVSNCISIKDQKRRSPPLSRLGTGTVRVQTVAELNLAIISLLFSLL